jgi:hypothetical protein
MEPRQGCGSTGWKFARNGLVGDDSLLPEADFWLVLMGSSRLKYCWLRHAITLESSVTGLRSGLLDGCGGSGTRHSCRCARGVKKYSTFPTSSNQIWPAFSRAPHGQRLALSPTIADFLGGEQRLENFGANVVWHSRPSIPNDRQAANCPKSRQGSDFRIPQCGQRWLLTTTYFQQLVATPRSCKLSKILNREEV